MVVGVGVASIVLAGAGSGCGAGDPVAAPVRAFPEATTTAAAPTTTAASTTATTRATATTAATRVTVTTRAVATTGTTATTSTTTPGPAGRSLVDRADERDGYQIHLMYVVPEDGEDRQLDLDGSLLRSAASFDDWFAGQNGGKRVRIDTFAGKPEVTFHRLPRTEADYTATGAQVRNVVDRDLVAAGFNHPRKVYAVYYDGGSTYSCGGGAWPPLLRGRVAALYLRGTPPNARPCTTVTIGPAGGPGYWEWSMLHEIIHTLGYVPTCAPHQHRSGHVPETSDLMYGGEEPWRFPVTLDIGRDDYFGHGLDNCPDLARSVFLDPLPAAAQLPPGW